MTMFCPHSLNLKHRMERQVGSICSKVIPAKRLTRKQGQTAGALSGCRRADQKQEKEKEAKDRRGGWRQRGQCGTTPRHRLKHQVTPYAGVFSSTPLFM